MAANGSNDQGMFGKMQDGFKEAGERMTEQQKEILLKLVENAEENVNEGFETLRSVIESENMADAIKLQNEAVSRSVKRNIEHMREMGQLIGANNDVVNRFSEVMGAMMPGGKS